MDLKQHIIDAVMKSTGVSVAIGHIGDEDTLSEEEKRVVAASMIEDIMQTIAKADAAKRGEVDDSDDDDDDHVCIHSVYAGSVAAALGANIDVIEQAKRDLLQGDATGALRVLDSIPIAVLKVIVDAHKSI